MPDVTVIVPTYCEAENLPVLVPRIHRSLAAAGIDGEVVVVDDSSPDGTVAACEELAISFPIRLVRRQERGLSGAVIEGMRRATGRILVVMDADLSHPPERIPALVNAIEGDGCEFVLGSRYVPSAGVAAEWGLFRRINSRAATWLARPLTSAKDPMAGFFALRRSTFERVSTMLDPVGYKIGLELIVKGALRRVAEIPIDFTDRTRGKSKLSFREQLNYLRHLARLYRYRISRCGGLGQIASPGL